MFKILKKFFKNKINKINKINNLLAKINPQKIPKHLAIIMDGNGRWANKRYLPRLQGHREGTNTVKKITDLCLKLNIPYLTLYAFSTENWKRPVAEVQGLMKLLGEFLDKELTSLIKKNIKLSLIGEISPLDLDLQKKIKQAIDLTKNNQKITVNLALNYGGRSEIIRAIKKLIVDLKDNKNKIEKLKIEDFKDFLDTKRQPDPDLLIRTGGEQRISNFLLWQIAYTEFYFTKILWPDFTEIEFLKSLLEYQNRQRRFGNVK